MRALPPITTRARPAEHAMHGQHFAGCSFSGASCGGRQEQAQARGQHRLPGDALQRRSGQAQQRCSFGWPGEGASDACSRAWTSKRTCRRARGLAERGGRRVLRRQRRGGDVRQRRACGPRGRGHRQGEPHSGITPGMGRCRDRVLVADGRSQLTKNLVAAAAVAHWRRADGGGAGVCAGAHRGAGAQALQAALLLRRAAAPHPGEAPDLGVPWQSGPVQEPAPGVGARGVCCALCVLLCPAGLAGRVRSDHCGRRLGPAAHRALAHPGGCWARRGCLGGSRWHWAASRLGRGTWGCSCAQGAERAAGLLFRHARAARRRRALALTPLAHVHRAVARARAGASQQRAAEPAGGGGAARGRARALAGAGAGLRGERVPRRHVSRGGGGALWKGTERAPPRVDVVSQRVDGPETPQNAALCVPPQGLQ